jgi:alanine racemase
MDMVRLGIGLYGVGFNDEEQQHLRNVSTLKAVISQIKPVKAGETIGYNRNGVARDDIIIGVIPIGYADGLDRRLGNGKGKLFIHGRPVSLVGNVCMDLCMADITGLSKEMTVNEGDEVIIFGDNYPISSLAADMETIPYEVLTGISRRVKRVYFHE